MAKVLLSSVTKHYRDDRGEAVCALDGLDLEVADGEFLVLVGPSGCGKSTVLRLIAGLEELTQGEIRIDDRNVAPLPPKDRDVALVFQSYALYPHMSVFENMAFGLKIRRVPRAEIDVKVREAAKLLQLDDCLDRLPKQLSGGQRQRVAVGRAILRHPKVFLFDEPLSNLDAQLRVQLRIELMRLHRSLKTTAIYVTHDQVEAMSMGDRIAVFSKGRLQQVADPRTLYRYPANAFVAGFIGSPPMNLICAATARTAGVSLPEADVLVGIRAEDFSVCASGTKSADRPSDGAEKADRPTLSGSIELVEFLGSESIVHVAVGDDRILARTTEDASSETAWRPGDAVELTFDSKQVHLFDAASGKRIKSSDANPSEATP